MRYNRKMVAFTSQQPRYTLNQLPLVLVDPALIQTDAATYQFRAHGDKQGVTRAHRIGRTRWDPILDGSPLLLHERKDGTLFVADGHHRLELANRTNAMGTGPGKVAAQILREADGFSAQDVRLIAAYKNLAQGNTNAVDAARVFKEVQASNMDVSKLPQLQMDKGDLTLSYRMAALPEQALALADALQVPAGLAAEVAGRFNDPLVQTRMMQMVGDTLRSGFVQRELARRANGAGMALN
jgi:hypothetical protein